MWEALKGWTGTAEIDGQVYDSIETAVSQIKAGQGEILIKLHPLAQKPIERRPEARPELPRKSSYETPTGEIKITVKKYMTEPASVGFDFMEKWNNNNPMPLRTMTGKVLQETKGMVKMELHGVGKPEICCMRCGRELTNPISRHYGIGPECMAKIGFVGVAIDDVDTIKEKLQNLTWTGWIIKSAITSQEDV